MTPPEAGDGASQEQGAEASALSLAVRAGLAGPAVRRRRIWPCRAGRALDLGRGSRRSEPASDPACGAGTSLRLVEIHGDLAVGDGFRRIEHDDAVAQRLGRGGPGVGLEAHGTSFEGAARMPLSRLDLTVGSRYSARRRAISACRSSGLRRFRPRRTRIVEVSSWRAGAAGLLAAGSASSSMPSSSCGECFRVPSFDRSPKGVLVMSP